MRMKHSLIALALLLVAGQAVAQTTAKQSDDDPVIMTVAGQPVARSEFEYSYNKNNTANVVDHKTVAEYVPLFIDYKLKVQAAKDAKVDTAAAFQKEYVGYRDQIVRPTYLTDSDLEVTARKMYDDAYKEVSGNGGMAKVSNIILLFPHKATAAQKDSVKLRIDSVYKALKRGADFAQMAHKISGDPQTAKDGGEIGWIMKGQTIKPFEDQVWALKDGEVSKPFEVAIGWVIVRRDSSKVFFTYDEEHANLLRYVSMPEMKERLINQRLDSIAHNYGLTRAQILQRKADEMAAADSNIRYLFQEYHDGLMLYDIADSMVWNRARLDLAGQAKYFKKHRANYTWDGPRFKGIAYATRQPEDVEAVKAAVKGKPFDEWGDILRTTFNNDSVLRIRVEKGIFKPGMNAQVDKEIFQKDTTVTTLKHFPNTGVYGRKLTAPEEVGDVREQVIADYQTELEKKWVEALRKRYKVVVDEKVVATVNKH